MLRPTIAVLALATLALAQPTSNSPLADKPNGMRRADSSWIALRNCTLHAKPGETLHHATIVLRDGLISAILPGDSGPDGKPGTDDDAPARAPIGPRIMDCTGLHAFAAFIEPYAEIDVPAPDASDPGRHWNASVTPQRSASSVAQNAASIAEPLRKLGFASACISPKGGIFRGRAALVSLAKPADDANAAAAKPPIYHDNVYNAVSLETAGQGYPDSQMGAIALIRQTLSDADWQQDLRANGKMGEVPNCLDSLSTHAIGTGSQPVETSLYYLFDCSDELEALRSLKIAQEFKRAPFLLGSGTEYRRLDAITAALKGSHAGLTYSKPAILLPLNFPQSPDVATPGKIEQTDLRELMSWEQAPTNPRRLVTAGIDFALTTHRLRNKSDFMANVRRAIAHGLTEDQALAALTVRPAEILGVSGQLGTIEPGKRASILLTDGPVFAKKNAAGKAVRVRDLYIDGQRLEINAPPAPELEGTWTLDLAGAPEATRALIFDKDNALTLTRNDKTVKGERITITQSSVSFTFDHEPLNDPQAETPGPTGIFTMSGLIEREGAGRPTALRGQGLRSTGERFSFTATRQPPSKLLGTWRISEADGTAKDPESKDQLDLTITPTGLTLKFTFESKDAITIKADDFTLADATLSFTHDLKKLGMEGKSTDTIRLEGDALIGESTLPDGSKHSYKAALAPLPSRKGPGEGSSDDDDATDPALNTKDIPATLGLPFGPYALEKLPNRGTWILSNATLWTNSSEGVFKGWICIEEGKIIAVAHDGPIDIVTKNPPTMIDCQGKHITPGIIDCHSHTGISRGVNEAGRSVSAEVRIADVTNPDDLSWYRQLAGGVTAVNSLHGSANAIGGQSQTNKNRWGAMAPDDLHMEGAKPGIKFALGENPTQMNGGRDRTRYPITRMGVETLIRDRFTQAREYAEATKRRSEPAMKGEPNDSSPPSLRRSVAAFPARRDLQLEAIAEILSGDRLVHCHSYRQDEILMLTQVAQDFKFKIGTFQHILEGYKVADKVRDFSGGGSGFTDWWAYKIEVQDAIPGGPVLMHEVGATVSYNSDSDELARRMNVEAAKAVKYSNGRIAPAEALKFVTLNPAKQLQIDNRVGTLEVGKDADIAIWSGDPLSAFSKCERTFVDGRELFSLEQDARHRDTIAKERARIIQKLLSKPKKDKKEGEEAKEGEKPADAPAEGPRRRRRPPNDMTSGSPSFQEGAGGRSGDQDAADSESELAIRRRLFYLDMLNRGLDPDTHRPGVCGCGESHGN